MEIVLWIIVCIIFFIAVNKMIKKGDKKIKPVPSDINYESHQERIFRLEREKYTPTQVFRDTSNRWEIIYDEEKSCLVYTDEFGWNNFVVSLSDIVDMSIRRNNKVAFTIDTSSKYCDPKTILDGWLQGGRFLKTPIKNLTLEIIFKDKEEIVTRLIDLFDVEEEEGRPRKAVRSIDDWLASRLIDSNKNANAILGIVLTHRIKEDERQEEEKREFFGSSFHHFPDLTSVSPN